MTFLEFAEKVLKDGKTPLSTIEIWEKGKEKGYTKELRTRGFTPWNTIGAQIYCDIRDNKNSKFLKIEGKPVFFLNEFKDHIDLKSIEKENKKTPDKTNEYLGKDMHKYLSNYVDIETMNILSKINGDFKELMLDIKIDYTSQRIRGNYDKVIAVEELYK